MLHLNYKIYIRILDLGGLPPRLRRPCFDLQSLWARFGEFCEGLLRDATAALACVEAHVQERIETRAGRKSALDIG